jgi:hypothetical protein
VLVLCGCYRFPIAKEESMGLTDQTKDTTTQTTLSSQAFGDSMPFYQKYLVISARLRQLMQLQLL